MNKRERLWVVGFIASWTLFLCSLAWFNGFANLFVLLVVTTSLGIFYSSHIMARLQIESMIKHFQQTNNLRNLAAEYVFLGIYYTNEGNKKKSLECAQKALSLLEPTEEWAVKSMALYHLGGEYLELGNTLDAEHYLELSLEAGEKARDRNACIVAMEKLAELHRKTGNREQEKFFVEKIKSIDNAI